MMTEKEMREAKVPTFDTLDELTDYIRSLAERDHDYGTSAYAASMAAVAAFYYIAGRLGLTGFQASCADLDIIRRTRRLKCPFMLIRAEDMLFPQYSIEGKVREALNDWLPWAREEARKKLAEPLVHVHPDVLRRWLDLAGTKDAQPSERREG